MLYYLSISYLSWRSPAMQHMLCEISSSMLRCMLFTMDDDMRTARSGAKPRFAELFSKCWNYCVCLVESSPDLGVYITPPNYRIVNCHISLIYAWGLPASASIHTFLWGACFCQHYFVYGYTCGAQRLAPKVLKRNNVSAFTPFCSA
jgi:hypothetical protein